MTTRDPVKISVSPEVVEAVIEAYDQGYHVSEIADVLGIGRSSVYRAAAVAGLGLERDMERTIAAVVPLWQSGLTVSQISDETGVSPTHIGRALHRAGIDGEDFIPAPYTPKLWAIPPLDPVWAAEFRGLFAGDGCAVIDRASNSYRPYMTIVLRVDDHEILEQIHSVLGGGLSNQRKVRKNQAPQFRWYVASWAGCRAVIEATDLDNPILLAKKRRDIGILYEAILARFEMPNQLGPQNKDILEWYRVQLQEVKRFQL